VNTFPPQTARKPRYARLAATLIALAFGGVLLMALVIALAANQAEARKQRPAAPSFSLTALNGSTVSLDDYRGLIVLLNFWASWCPPCRVEMPDLDAFHQQYRSQGFAVVSVNVGEDVGTVKAFIEAEGLRFPVLLDPTGVVYRQYGENALPHSFIIGRNGELIKVYPAGRITRQQLDRDILPLLRR